MTKTPITDRNSVETLSGDCKYVRGDEALAKWQAMKDAAK